MRRFVVVGSSSGAGKTTFARALAARLALPHIELDALHWQQTGWELPEREVFRERVDRATSAEAWVLDGNYSAHLVVHRFASNAAADRWLAQLPPSGDA